MKKLILIASVVFTMNSLTAQTNTAAPANRDNTLQAPKPVTSRFSNDYPDMQPSWSMDGTNYRAEYMDGTMGHTITYDPKGKMISREEQLTNGNYPSTVGDYYAKTYPGETYEVWSSTDAVGEQTYYTNRNDETIWFDKSGKYKNTKKKARKNK